MKDMPMRKLEGWCEIQAVSPTILCPQAETAHLEGIQQLPPLEERFVPALISAAGRDPLAEFQCRRFYSAKNEPASTNRRIWFWRFDAVFLRQNCLVVTVEHDPGWFRAVELAVRAEGHQGRWTGLHETPFVIPGSPNHDYENPDSYFSSESRNLNYRSYASALDRFPDAFFDLVLVDGRARPSCIKHAVAKKMLGGFLVVDNTERSYYLSDKTRAHLKNFLPVFDEFGPTPGLGHFTRATIFQKLANI